MKKIWAYLKLISVTFLVICMFSLFFWYIHTEQWINLAKFSIFTVMGFSISYFGLIDAIIWKWKRVIKHKDYT